MLSVEHPDCNKCREEGYNYALKLIQQALIIMGFTQVEEFFDQFRIENNGTID